MAYSSRVTSRYAKSVLGLAEELKSLEPVKDDMAGIVAICEENGDLLHFLTSPIIAHERKEIILKTVFEGKVNELERDGLIKQILYKSATWLETVIFS